MLTMVELDRVEFAVAYKTDPIFHILSIDHCGEDIMDFLSITVFNRIKDMVIEDVVGRMAGDKDADYKHDLHMYTRIGETT